MNSFKPSLVFVDENAYTLALLTAQFKETHNIFTVRTEDELFRLVTSQDIHVLVCSQRMTSHTGIELLRQVKVLSPSTVRILLTGYADLAMIVGTVEEDDIYRYITMPWQPEELQRTVHSATKLALESQIIDSGAYSELNSTPEKILVIDDCEETHDLLVTQFMGNYEVLQAKNIDQVVDQISSHQFGVIIADVKLNGVDITPLIATFKERMPETFTVLLTRLQEADRLVELIRQGKVYRCLPKPIRASLLDMSVQRAFEKHRQLQSRVDLMLDNGVEVKDESILRIQKYLTEIKKRREQQMHTSAPTSPNNLS